MSDTKVVGDYLIHVAEEIEGMLMHLEQTRETIRSARLQMGNDPMLRLLLRIINDTDDKAQEMDLAWHHYRNAMAVIGICQEEEENDEDEGQEDEHQDVE